MFTKRSLLPVTFFASTIMGQCRELEGVHAFEMDGEQALMDVLNMNLVLLGMYYVSTTCADTSKINFISVAFPHK